MTLATRLTATAAPALAADDSEWVLFITDLSDTSTISGPVGVWWATDGATDADRDLICYVPADGDPSTFAASWVPNGIMQLDGDTLVGVLVDTGYSDSVVTVADLTGTEVDDGPIPFDDSFDDGLIGLPVKSFDETLVEAGFAKRYDQLADVAATGDDAPTDGQTPIWDDTRSRWVPGTVSASGGAPAGVDLATETAGSAAADVVIAAGKAAVNVELTDTLTEINLPALPSTTEGSGFTLYLTPAPSSPGSFDDVSFTVEGGGSALMAGSVELGDGLYVWRVEPDRAPDGSFVWVLFPMVSGAAAASFPISAQAYTPTGSAPDYTLDMSAHPADKAGAVITMAAGSGETLVITEPDGDDYGDIDVIVAVDGDVTVSTTNNSDLLIPSVQLGSLSFVFATFMNVGDGVPMVLVPSGFNAAPSGAAGGDLAGTYPNPTVPGLADKLDANAPITGATKTKITYDADGLVTAGADATTADIADSTDKRYVTDAGLTVLGNTSGTNTGDATSTTEGALVHGATGKTTPVDADEVPIVDSAASNILKKVTWANVKATLKTYFDGLYAPATLVSSDDSTTSVTPALGEANQLKRLTNASLVTVTIPPNSSVAFPLNTQLIFHARGAAGATLAAGAGVTIRNNSTATFAQYSEISVRKDGTDEWVRVG